MNDIQCMAAARDSLERYADSVNNYSNINSEYKKIYESILEYIKKQCNHKLVEDDIDIGIDKTQHITYCEYCLTNF
jgi:transcriptional regulator